MAPSTNPPTSTNVPTNVQEFPTTPDSVLNTCLASICRFTQMGQKNGWLDEISWQDLAWLSITLFMLVLLLTRGHVLSCLKCHWIPFSALVVIPCLVCINSNMLGCFNTAWHVFVAYKCHMFSIGCAAIHSSCNAELQGSCCTNACNTLLGVHQCTPSSTNIKPDEASMRPNTFLAVIHVPP